MNYQHFIMMKRILSTILVLAVSATAFAQNNKFTGALLWKISGNNLDEPSYILGTHHLTDGSFTETIPGFKEAFSNVDQVIGEMNMSDMESMQMQMQMAMMMPADKSYKTLLTEKEFGELDNGLKPIFGAGLDQLGMIKPGMISTLFVTQLYAMSHPDLNPNTFVAIDVFIQQQATAANKEVKGLENIEDQIYALFESEPLESQAKSLHCTIMNKEFAKESLILLTKYYGEGDLIKMYELAFENKKDPCPSSENFSYALNKERNDKWLVKIPFMIKTKPALIAVGALHLCGEDGLLYQLEKMGYKVEAVK